MALKRCTTCNGAGKKKVFVRWREDGPAEGAYRYEERRCEGECGGQGWIVVPDRTDRTDR